jgi:hypothetical protein
MREIPLGLSDYRRFQHQLTAGKSASIKFTDVDGATPSCDKIGHDDSHDRSQHEAVA